MTEPVNYEHEAHRLLAEVQRLQGQVAAAWEAYREHNEANHMEPPGSWERLAWEQAWEQKAHWQQQAMLAILRKLPLPPEGPADV